MRKGGSNDILNYCICEQGQNWEFFLLKNGNFWILHNFLLQLVLGILNVYNFRNNLNEFTSDKKKIFFSLRKSVRLLISFLFRWGWDKINKKLSLTQWLSNWRSSEIELNYRKKGKKESFAQLWNALWQKNLILFFPVDLEMLCPVHLCS